MAELDVGLDALIETMRVCLTPSAAKRPPVGSVLQQLASRGARPDGGLPWWSNCSYANGGHLAGQLSITGLRVRELYPKSASGGVKAYVLVTCGGVRRLTQVAPRARDASWSTPIVLSTNPQRKVKLAKARAAGGKCRPRPRLSPQPLA